MEKRKVSTFLANEEKKRLLKSGKDIPQDASGFANELRKFLRTKYGIESKNNSPSLGYAQIIIGEK